MRELKRKFIGDWENSAVFCKTGYLKSFLTKCWMSTLHFLLKNRAYLSINAKLLKYYGRQIRKDVRFERTVHVSAEKLGISGVLDLVEVDTKTGCLKPVEYKRGKPKPDPMDETAAKPRRPTTANAAKPAHWWRFARQSCWGNGIGVWGMLSGCLGMRVCKK